MIRFAVTKAAPSMIAVALLTISVPAFAEDVVTPEAIVQALKPKTITRTLSAATPAESAKAAAESRFVETLRNRKTRSLSSEEREEITTIAADKPKIDLEITFDYDSADINAKSMSSAQALGKALSDPALKGSTFVVAGHTDAKGGESYNQGLSERRADAIKHYLVDKFGIAGTDLVTVGYGKSKPKDPGAPMDPANRRVQVVNMEAKTASQ
jgi:outer membrane protein OmpA-like peptidoglycan-associated protein